MDKIKKELRTLIGESVLLFQRYEYTFKSLLTLSLIEGSTESLKNNLNSRIERISKKSLGQLVRQYLDELVDPIESSLRDDSGLQSVYITMRFSIETADISKSNIEEKYKSFVDDRNFVVHHLISELIPNDESSYSLMINKLTNINEKFEKDLQELVQTRRLMLDAYNHILSSNEMRKLKSSEEYLN